MYQAHEMQSCLAPLGVLCGAVGASQHFPHGFIALAAGIVVVFQFTVFFEPLDSAPKRVHTRARFHHDPMCCGVSGNDLFAQLTLVHILSADSVSIRDGLIPELVYVYGQSGVESKIR